MSEVFEVVKVGKEEQRVRDESKWVVSIKCKVISPSENRCSINNRSNRYKTKL